MGSDNLTPPSEGNMVKVEAQDNAASMLHTQAKYLETIGTIEYYILDGKMWIISCGTIYRADDHEESNKLRQTVNEAISQRKVRLQLADTCKECTSNDPVAIQQCEAINCPIWKHRTPAKTV